MSTARWEDKNPDVPINAVKVFRCGQGFHVQLGQRLLWVHSRGHWDDIATTVAASFADLIPARQIPARTDGVKPTDYTTVNCSGACFEGEDE